MSQASRTPALRLAAQYLRMSTDKQDYSLRNQEHAIAQYAAENGMDIVRTYSDQARSGLGLSGRQGLQDLLADVQAGNANFEILLVYDISRWGRFQDTDESAYYEYICRSCGVQVEYCAEPFANDGSPYSAVLKSLKRAMAAEYSRELSEKVRAGHRRLAADGFHQGGRPGYGLRRLLVDADGRSRGVLRSGEQKNIKTDRIVLISGPTDEIEIVRQIFQKFTFQSWSVRRIADWLNRAGIRAEAGGRWNDGAIRNLLRNEKYIGRAVYGKTQGLLKRPRRKTIRDSWLCAESRSHKLIEPWIFQKAQETFRQLNVYSDSQMIDFLREILQVHGRITSRLIDSTHGAPHSSLYKKRFKGLNSAYQMAGYRMPRETRYIQDNRTMRSELPDVVLTLAELLRPTHSDLRIEGTTLRFAGWSVEILAKRAHLRKGRLIWDVPLGSTTAELVVVARYDPSGSTLHDFYIVPCEIFVRERVVLTEDNGFYLSLFKARSLEQLARTLEAHECWA